ncbi:hypothetical protein WG66_011819, partial [Moniliophthora roreri]
MSRRLYLANDSSLTTSKTPEEVKIFNDRAQKVFQRLTEQQDCDVGSLCSYPLVCYVFCSSAQLLSICTSNVRQLRWGRSILVEEPMRKLRRKPRAMVLFNRNTAPCQCPLHFSIIKFPMYGIRSS